MSGEGTLDYELYLNTKALLSCQTKFEELCNADELQFIGVAQLFEFRLAGKQRLGVQIQLVVQRAFAAHNFVNLFAIHKLNGQKILRGATAPRRRPAPCDGSSLRGARKSVCSAIRSKCARRFRPAGPWRETGCRSRTKLRPAKAAAHARSSGSGDIQTYQWLGKRSARSRARPRRVPVSQKTEADVSNNRAGISPSASPAGRGWFCRFRNWTYRSCG